MDNWLNALELRQIYIILGSILLLVVTALLTFFGKPLYEQRGLANQQLTELRATLVTSPKDRLELLAAEVQQMEQDLLGNLRNVPVRQLESHVIAALQRSAWESDTQLLSVEPQRPTNELPYQELAFRVEVLGRYSNLDDWLRALALEMGDVVVKEYDLNIEQVGDDPLLRGRLMLTAYRVEGV